jgi:hypothetical protein
VGFLPKTGLNNILCYIKNNVNLNSLLFITVDIYIEINLWHSEELVQVEIMRWASEACTREMQVSLVKYDRRACDLLKQVGRK